MAGFKRFEDIKAWQCARELVRAVYQTCASSALGREFGLKEQLCRAAVSSMSNIAEGFSRKSDRDFAHFLDMARGSCAEVQSLLYVALDVGHLSQQRFDDLYASAEATAAMIGRLTNYLRGPRGTNATRPRARPNSSNSGS
jgi:four helix bundle protein